MHGVGKGEMLGESGGGDGGREEKRVSRCSVTGKDDGDSAQTDAWRGNKLYRLMAPCVVKP